MEIHKPIGRSLRAVTDSKLLGNRTFFVNYDVIQADGATPTYSITETYVAIHKASNTSVNKDILRAFSVKSASAWYKH